MSRLVLELGYTAPAFRSLSGSNNGTAGYVVMEGGTEGVGRGWSTAMRCLAHGGIHIAALCVGMAGRLVDETVE